MRGRLPRTRETVDFSGIKVDNLSLLEALQKTEGFIRSGKPHLIVTPNPELIVAAQKDAELKAIINSADLCIPDGISMVVVSRILGRPLKERVSGIDLMLKLCETGARAGWRVFLFGSAPGVAEEAQKELRLSYPGINIVGTENGFQGDDLSIVDKIRSAAPHLLFVGLGMGRQERWLNRHLKELGVPVGMTIGGSLDVISGRKKRAPQWAQVLYIEWLYRLFSEPWRWKRQTALPKFLWIVFTKGLRYNSEDEKTAA